MLSSQAIKEFKKIYLNKYGIILPEKEAEKYANGLIGLYKNILFEQKQKEMEIYRNGKNKKHLSDK